MTQAIYIVGAHGSGKTTLLQAMVRGLTELAPLRHPDYGQLVTTPLTWDGHMAGHALGTLDRGTDALSFNIAPAAVRWATEAHLPAVIYGEGTRLGFPRFLTALATRTHLTVVHLGGGTSGASATKAANAARAAEEAGATVLPIQPTGDPAETFLATLGAIGARR